MYKKQVRNGSMGDYLILMTLMQKWEKMFVMVSLYQSIKKRMNGFVCLKVQITHNMDRKKVNASNSNDYDQETGTKTIQIVLNGHRSHRKG